MIGILYRFILKHGMESQFQDHWQKLQNFYINEKDALGSTLYKTQENLWIAYSRWPDKATRDAAWPGHNDPDTKLPEEIQQTIKDLKECVEVEFPETIMQMVQEIAKDSKKPELLKAR